MAGYMTDEQARDLLPTLARLVDAVEEQDRQAVEEAMQAGPWALAVVAAGLIVDQRRELALLRAASRRLWADLQHEQNRVRDLRADMNAAAAARRKDRK